MKKTIIFVFMLVFALSATTFTTKADTKIVSEETTVNKITESELTEEEMNHLTLRVEEIRDMDRSALTLEEKHELRSELKEIRENARRGSSTIYIGTGTLLLIIILILLLS
jgi:predicted Holliday junction resolvase-like endonuclease